MQQITSPSVDKRPSVGYQVSKEERKQKFYDYESHIPVGKQTLLSELKADSYKLRQAVTTYFPKAFAGSKNSDFYEFITLGMVPNLVGSAMLIGLSSAANKYFNRADATAAGMNAKQVGAGVILYGVGKWAYQRLSRAMINASTNINHDLKYYKQINELPEPGRDKGVMRMQILKLDDTIEFRYADLLAKDGEMNHDNIYYHDDKVTKKAGFKNRLHAPNQTVAEKARKLKARVGSIEHIGKYIIAATGVALGSQKAFRDLKFNPKSIIQTFAQAGKQLWNGPTAQDLGRNVNGVTKHAGKALVIASALTTLLTWLIPTIGFKTNPDTIKTKIDTKKEFEVC